MVHDRLRAAGETQPRNGLLFDSGRPRVANGNGTAARKRRKRALWIGVSLALIALLVLGITAAKRSSTKIDVSKLARVDRGDLAKSVVATGKIEPMTRVELKSKASGIVKRLLVDFNDQVREGQVLAELDREEIEAEVRSAEAQLQSSEANQSAATADLKRAEVDAESPDVPLLKRAYDRAVQMRQDGVVSDATLEDAQKDYELAVNKRDVARAVVVEDKAKVAQAQADVQRERATLTQLQEQLGYTTIVSPINGIVLSRDVEVGDAVSSILVMGSASTLIMTLGDTSQVYVKGKVDESDIGKVYLGQPARIKVESFKDKTFAGRVTKISPMGVEKDNVTTFEVRVSIENSAGELRANMTANAEILLEEHKNVLQIPEGALIYDKDKKAYVEIPDPRAREGKKKVPVQVGIANGSKAEILSGLKEGGQVVLQ
jgi:HlyD family secretion protein